MEGKGGQPILCETTCGGGVGVWGEGWVDREGDIKILKRCIIN